MAGEEGGIYLEQPDIHVSRTASGDEVGLLPKS
jgi:hypothetical protein